MAESFYHYRRGYLRISMTGCAPERFFNICQGHGIEIWDIGCRKGRYEFYMTVEGFKKGKGLVRKAGVRLKIEKKLGLPFFLYRNRKRKMSFVGFVFFFFFIYTMSLFLWDIKFEGNSRYSSDTLMDFLESQEIFYGMMIKNLSCEDLEDSIRMEFPEISWVSAQVSGTRLLVKIKENQALSSIPQKDDSPCDIVAEKPGIVTSMIVRQGRAEVKIGDRVEKGQVLISGVLSVTDDSETVTAYHYVHADGEVKGLSEVSYEEAFPAWRTIESYTGKKKKGLFVKVFSYSVTLMPPFLSVNIPGTKTEEEKLWKTAFEEHQMKLFQDFYLPFYWGLITRKEYDVYERMYTEEEKEGLKMTVNSKFLENLEEKGVQIIKNDVRIQERDGGFAVVCSAETEESLGVSSPLSITDSQDEMSGSLIP